MTDIQIKYYISIVLINTWTLPEILHESIHQCIFYFQCSIMRMSEILRINRWIDNKALLNIHIIFTWKFLKPLIQLVLVFYRKRMYGFDDSKCSRQTVIRFLHKTYIFIELYQSISYNYINCTNIT